MRIQPLLIFFCLLTASGCVSYDELVNFQDLRVGQGRTELIDNTVELKIQPRDLLRIEVKSADPLAAAPFNENAGTGGLGQVSAQNIQLFQGYLVDLDGFVDLPLLGRVEAGGQTVESLQFLIRGKLTTYIKDPVVNVRYLNFKVTVLGEVQAPGVISLPNSRVTVLEAIGLAGDLSDYADRTDILVVREENGERSFQRLNLQSDEIFMSDYYYLKQNDVIYVEPIRARTATVSDPAQRFLAYLTTALSVIGITIALTTGK